jgi:hypothetical protein
MHESVPVGPLKIAVALPDHVAGNSAQSRVKGESLPVRVHEGWAHIEIPSILEHELLVIE